MITPRQWQMLTYVEQCWHAKGEFPDPEFIFENCNEYATIGEVLADLESTDLDKQFEVRGIEKIRVQKSATKTKTKKRPTPNGNLTAEQLAAIHTVLNVADNRTFRSKLEDLGISETTFGGWLQSKKFLDYYRNKAEKALHEGLPLAHFGLIQQASRGNVKAIEFYYKLTNYYTGAESEQLMNMKVFIHRIIEIIQARIDDPVILKAISTEMLGIIGMGENQAEQIIKGEVEHANNKT